VDFKVVLIEGVFDVAHKRTLADALSPLIGQHIRIAAHHLPSNPVDPTRWGGGSCTYQPGLCPYQHHVDPTRMYSYTGEGVLDLRIGDNWVLTKFDGTVESVGLSALKGHQGRVAAAPIFSVEQMRDTVAASDIAGADLGVRAEELKAVLNRLRGK
jgi:hypothetical protein